MITLKSNYIPTNLNHSTQSTNLNGIPEEKASLRSSDLNKQLKDDLSSNNETYDCSYLIQMLESVNDCILMKEGYHSKLRLFYFCLCDPDMQEPICKACLTKCHSAHWKGHRIETIPTDLRVSLCHCGQNNHHIQQIQRDFEYQTKCLFMEWSYISKTHVYYVDLFTNQAYCMFCYWLCHKRNSNLQRMLNQTNEGSRMRYLNGLTCECKHDDCNVIYDLFGKLCKRVPFIFENLKATQFANMVLLAQDSFNNTFHKLNDMIDYLKMEVEDPNFAFDFLVNNSNFLKAIDKIETMFASVKSNYYLKEKIKCGNFVFPLLIKKDSYNRENNIITLKKNILSIYHQTCFLCDFEILPKINYKAFINMNPFQRLMFADYFHTFPKTQKYIDLTIQHNHIEKLLYTIERYKSNSLRSKDSYKILHLIYNECKRFALFNCFTPEQSLKLFTLNDEIIYKSIAQKDTDAFTSESQMKMLSQMVKCLLYMAYYQNDKALEKHMDINSLTNTNNNTNYNSSSSNNNNDMYRKTILFFHGSSETSKMIYRNTIYILHYCKTLYTNSTKRDLSLTQTTLNKHAEMLRVITKYHNKIMFIAMEIIALTLNCPDAYSFGLRSLFTKNKERIMMYYINNANLNESEKYFVEKVKGFTIEMERIYKKYYKFKMNDKEVERNVYKILAKFLRLVGQNVKPTLDNRGNAKQKGSMFLTLQEGLLFNRNEIAGTHYDLGNTIVSCDGGVNNILKLAQNGIGGKSNNNNGTGINDTVVNGSNNNNENEESGSGNLKMIRPSKHSCKSSITAGKFAHNMSSLLNKYNGFMSSNINNNNNVNGSILDNSKHLLVVPENDEIAQTNNMSCSGALNNNNNGDKNRSTSDTSMANKFEAKNINQHMNFLTNNQHHVEPDISRILLNKTPFVFTMIKSIQVLLLPIQDERKCEVFHNINNDHNADKPCNELMEVMFRVLFFFIKDSPDNCFLILNRLILDTFILLPDTQSHRCLGLLEYTVRLLKEKEYYICHINPLIKYLHILALRTGNSKSFVYNFEQILTIFKMLCKLNLLHQEHIFMKLRKVMKKIWVNNDILIQFRNVLIAYYINDPSSNLEDVLDSDDFFAEYDVSLVIGIFVQFLKTINYIFDGNSILNEKDFLSNIFKKKDIPTILLDKALNIHLRVELLRFFRLVYIDTMIDPRGLDKYYEIFNKGYTNDPMFNSAVITSSNLASNSSLTNVNKLNSNTNINNNNTTSNNNVVGVDVIQEDKPKNFVLFHQLLKVSEHDLSCIVESKMLLHELECYNDIINKSKVNEVKIMFRYFENGIMLPLFILLKKYMSFIINVDINERVKLYDIVLHFLQLKKQLYEHYNNIKEMNDISTNGGGNNKLLAAQPTLRVLFKETIPSKKAYSNLFWESLHSTQQHQQQQQQYQLSNINNDISTLLNDSFDKNDYNTLYNIFVRSVNGLFKKERTKYLKDMFSKKQKVYTPEQIIAKEKKYKKEGLLSTEYETKLWQFIIHYENTKAKYQDSSLNKNLKEKNIYFDSTYRSITLNPMFFLINREKLYLKYRRQNFWHIFRLLQYDTCGTQADLLNIINTDFNKHNRPTIDFVYLTNIFMQNLLSLIFSSCNPSLTTSADEDYTIAYMVIKIMKYMCEEHNIDFQTIFFQHIKLIKNKTRKQYINMFDFLMCVLTKIVVLTKWDKASYDEDESKVSYFYEIFFVMIEFSIEMIQGTSKENLERIFNKCKDEYKAPFYQFLSTIKNVVTNNNNNSEILYTVRLDLINFIVAFLEEKNSPKKLINVISNLFNPFTIFDLIVNTLKKIYIKYNKNEINDDIMFDSKKCKYFMEKYFSDSDFSKSKEFEFITRMFDYVKLLSTVNNKDAKRIIDSIKLHSEDEINKLMHTNNKAIHSVSGNNSGDSSNDAVVSDPKYIENYYTVKFLEAINRQVWIQGNDVKPQLVIFTVDPSLKFLSQESKDLFFRSVPRDSRTSKLFGLIEHVDYFVLEIQKNKTKVRGNKILLLISQINFRVIENMLFIITLITCGIVLFLSHNTNSENSYNNIYTITLPLSVLQIFISAFAIVCWMFTKFDLYYHIEKQKYCHKYHITNIYELTLYDYFVLTVLNSILYKKEIISFIWNLVFALYGSCCSINVYIFSIQLLIAVNISEGLYNILLATLMRKTQLLVTLGFLLIILFVFSNIAFYFFRSEYVHVIEGEEENTCSTLMYCFLTHCNFGLRIDGGIAEFMAKQSFNETPGYFMGIFFFQFLFFLIVIVIMLAVIGGMIIDTSAELREKMRRIRNDVQNVCFICNGSKNDIERNGEKFDEHINKVHNIWVYIEYLIGLRFVDPQETNAINSFVIEQLQEKKISWFPAFEETDSENNYNGSDDEIMVKVEKE